MADFLAVVPKAPQKELQPAGVLDDDARPRFNVGVPNPMYLSSASAPSTPARPSTSPPTSPLEGDCEVRRLSESDLANLMPQVYGSNQLADQPDKILMGEDNISIPGCLMVKISEECDVQEENSEKEKVPDHASQHQSERDDVEDRRISAPQMHEPGAANCRLSISGLMPSYGAGSVVDTPGQRQISKNSQIRTSTYAVSKTLKKSQGDSSERIGFQEGVEPSMQMYLEDHCIDGPSSAWRRTTSVKLLMSIIVLLPMLSFSVLFLPLTAPEKGFHQNWVFNYLAHPALNYVVCRAELEIGLRRPLAPSDRPRIAWVMRWCPLIGCVACIFIHFMASLFGVYPMPFAAATSCIPSAFITLFVGSYLIPENLLTSDLRAFIQFAYLELIFWTVQFGVLTLWLEVFPALSVPLQLLSSAAVTAMLAGAGWAVNKIGPRYLGVPEYITEEAKVFILFGAFLFSAALLSSAKNGVVLCVMLILDAGKALAIALKTCGCLIAVLEEMALVEELEAGSAESRLCKMWRNCRALPLLVYQKWRLAFQVRKQLNNLVIDLAGKTRESLQESEITIVEARLLNEFARHAKVFALVELCEVAVPLMYMMVMALLHTETFGYNRQYYEIFSSTGQGYQDAMIGNAMSFLIEAFVFVAAQVAFLQSTGFDLAYFAGPD
ncbi:Uncharacterized protein SCF082_LOCUS3311 [Durusdinium trenchii]|uniref:Uncharacterized protein n=1 Tax=Durusdinium trenchii TaxID=1381693 RepID=A0ABP0HTJ1_9DINO